MQYKKTDLIVLIPAYREELTIASMIVLSLQYSDTVIVVDDGSPDRTSEIAEKSGAQVIRHEKNRGKAAALMTGFEACKKHDPKCVVMIDGDGQMDPSFIPSVIKPIMDDEADLVIGSRFLETKQDIPSYRKIGQRLLNKATNIGSNAQVSDSQSGYRALSRKGLDNMNFSSDSYNIESDMIAYFSQRGLRIKEVPVDVRYDVPYGHKKNPIHHGFSVMERIISYIGYRKALIVFGIPGLILFMIGLILCVATFFEYQMLFDWTLVTQGIAGISFFGVGMFLMFASLILNSLGILMQDIMSLERK